MKYTAPDGHIIESNPASPVTYECEIGGVAGTYISLETKAANNSIGIEQIQITRVITDSTTTITIVESTDSELLDYISSTQNI